MSYRRTILCSVAVVAAALATAGCTAFAPPTVQPSSHKTVAAVAHEANAEDRFAILHRAFTSTDALPDDTAAVEDDEVVLNSQRRAGSDHGTTFWIAETKSGGACLIAHNPDPKSANTWTICSSDHMDKGAQVTGMSDETQHGYLFMTDGYAPVGANPPRKITANVWAD
ncbi:MULTISPECIES: hypothetical protein [unclassified Frondihabitans]|uniref:hypothetical protein n=1 Tax=unclassified Frondihabitans TaxID=2626248 RepID=UPI000F5080E7|nr:MULTISPECIES: hypothetical protein [unclassified Frondihabitans]RPE74263.1 hypothetical protein EDF37_3004 [Frondihabitans sp. PhB153]RPF02693.1 hypothetical protein EDF39_3072 [Frondihabitans sp. PhB161]